MLARAWSGLGATFARLSDSGVDRVPPSHVRMVQGANHFFLISTVTNAPLVLLIAIGSWPLTLSPAVSHLAMIIGWYVAVFLNGRGRLAAASLLGIALPLIQYVYLSVLFSARSLFEVQLLLLGGLIYVVFVPTRWRWGLLFSVVGLLTAAVLVAVPGFAEPRVEVPAWWLSIAAAYNLANVAFFLFLTGFFNNSYLQRERRRNQDLLSEAHLLAVTDSLTGLYNRRGIEPELQSAEITGDYVLAIADVDHFKQINDRLGHQVGDEVLSEVAADIRAALPRAAAIARWGGEEFLVVMIQTQLPDALTMLDRARAAAEREITVDDETEHVTISIGAVRVDRPGSVDVAIARADGQLYEAKREGRNMVRGVTLRERARRRLPEAAGDRSLSGG